MGAQERWRPLPWGQQEADSGMPSRGAGPVGRELCLGVAAAGMARAHCASMKGQSMVWNCPSAQPV